MLPAAALGRAVLLARLPAGPGRSCAGLLPARPASLCRAGAGRGPRHRQAVTGVRADASGAQSAEEPTARKVQELPISLIRRPFNGLRPNDQEKVQALMASISEIGLQVPIDVLEVDGVYYGFSGCHRFEAHQRLHRETIRCRVRKVSREVLRMHMA